MLKDLQKVLLIDFNIDNMLAVLLVLLCCLASSSLAWMPTKARNSNVNSIIMSSSATGRSKSIPFLIQPPNLDGSLAGDEGNE